MKTLVITFVLGLGIFIGNYSNFSIFAAESRPCSFDGETFEEGETRTSGRSVYVCRDGKWIRVS